jgi:hypothetical protein
MIPVVWIGLLLAGDAVRQPQFRVTPRVIEVGAFYDGADVRVEGVAAPRSRVIVTVSGSDREERFKRKARFGPIWISAGLVRISGAPSLFLRFGEEAAGDRCFDEAAVTARMSIEPSSGRPADDAVLRAGFLALKKSEGTYAFSRAGVVMDPPGDGGVPYHVKFQWPKKAPPGEYEVRVYEVCGGVLEAEAGARISVVRTGFPAWMADLAENRAAVYGASAVLIGALAGFAIDFLTTRIFGKKRPTAH